MIQTTTATIATALSGYLAAQLQGRTKARAFFRISGFHDAVYRQLLDHFAQHNWYLHETPLEVRSIDPVAGHEQCVVDPGRSATWYRNNPPKGHALVLIQNRLSSDAQSLKDLFPVTELSLSREGLPQLLAACLRNYQLTKSERELLMKFVRRSAALHREPQLADLTEFLLAVDQLLHRQPGIGVARAMVQSLHHLGLFCCLELEHHLNTPRGDTLLRQLKQAARIGSEVLEERLRNDYLQRLAQAPLDDEMGGMDREQKRELIRRFIEGDLRDDYAARRQVYQIDWREMQHVITLKSRLRRDEKLVQVASQLAQALEPEAATSAEVVQDVLADLRAGREPDDAAIDQLLTDYEAHLERPLRNALRSMLKQRHRKHGDLLVGLTTLAVELLMPLQAQLQAGTQLHVNPHVPDELDEPKQKGKGKGKRHTLRHAIATLRTLYGGCTSHMPAFTWNLQPLWELETALANAADDDGDEAEEERLAKYELSFKLSVLNASGEELARGELVWLYRSDSPAALTMRALESEYAQLQAQGQAATPRLRVPLFNTCPTHGQLGDLDLSHPIQSFGNWFEQPGDLRDRLEQQLAPRTRETVLAPLRASLSQLEAAWGQFVAIAATDGLLAADLPMLLTAYQDFLATSLEQLRSPQEMKAGFKLLNQAWIVGQPNFPHWALMPLMHPLKLHWWHERARYFNQVVAQLLNPDVITQIVDEVRYRRELVATYSSSGNPAILTLAVGEGRPAVHFVPAEETEGYELFLREREEHETLGCDPGALAEDEADLAAQRAVESITAVVQDYIETYPFVRDGLELLLFECRNAALPGLLVQQLTRLSQRHNWQLRLAVQVHTSNRGAPLFRRVSAWVKHEAAGTEQRTGAYFPPVSLKVLEVPADRLCQLREDSDIVILADVLASKGQHISAELQPCTTPDLPAPGYLPTARALQEPFQEGDLHRRILLTPPQQPTVLRLFHLCQYAAHAKINRPFALTSEAQFYRELSLDEWEMQLAELHQHFNWVICYDPTIDRFLLRAAFANQVEVIRYSLGLGAKRQHNLTVSSAQSTKQLVIRRLAARLAALLPNTEASFLDQVAEQLVRHANTVSGDIVLRAAGPGAFLNELIGLVAAKFATERRYAANQPNALTTWILLDDVEHWFKKKFPDMLFVAVKRNANGGLHLHLEILEAKCVGQISFEAEARDAEEQVRCGVNQLAPAFAPGNQHLDALYWYDQLYRALVGSIVVPHAAQPLWELLRDNLHQGNFTHAMSGHIWAFCYDGQLGANNQAQTYAVATRASDAPDVAIYAHHYGRNDLCQLLRDLIESEGDASFGPHPLTPSPACGRGGTALDEGAAPFDPHPLTPSPASVYGQTEHVVTAAKERKGTQQNSGAFAPLPQRGRGDARLVSLSNQSLSKGVGGEGHPEPRHNLEEHEATLPPSPTTWERGPGGEGHPEPRHNLEEHGATLPPSPTTWERGPGGEGHPESPASSPPASPPPASPPPASPPPPASASLASQARELQRALRQRGIQVQPIDPAQADIGPSVIRFKFRLSGSESLKKLQAAAVDLARDLALIRAPFIDNVAGTNFVGVDLPRSEPELVPLQPLLSELPTPGPGPGELPIIIGKTPDGRLQIEDLATFPHLLVAGATNSGKSVFLRSILLGLMAQYQPGGVELLIVDPKQTDFSFFEGLAYLRGGQVFTNAQAASEALLELVRSEMPRRQQLMRGRSMKLKEFNERFPAEALPPIVAMIDEYAQLLSIQSKKDAESFERDLMSLAAVARATGIHLILATQRPSVNVVTGTLKANLPARIAFQVPTNNDSRVVLDQGGAENLLGRGDMLFRRPSGELLRLQAPFMDEVTMQAWVKDR
ncbi:DNA translocase FtsK [Candidatus Viridilinea mediisalina]|uniref:FtsK domain-containing protein n=1 Tax=Candidatus Viridilinea mediisalina TaxID=2024553 RepID=A0A2A6RI11_9CHLR|nr:DNA translocase FtsK [Candidatus Viridilinea mediisalina]PDW02508.1 hypothetical protein CJ255_13580 [Candidatus Viridilinea mediisalina]